MSAVTCVPLYEDPRDPMVGDGDWPDSLLGDGFIRLDYLQDDCRGTAWYRDQFGEDYEVKAFRSGLIVADVRED